MSYSRSQQGGGPRFDDAQAAEQRDDFDNLILLCRNHHKIVDGRPKIFLAEALDDLKRTHEEATSRPEQPTEPFFAKILLNDLQRIEVSNNSGNVVINSPGTILAETVNLKTTRREVHIQPAAGTIGADLNASRYVQHLIGSYNEFASADYSRARKFSYGAISKNIETTFRSPWKMLSADRFEAVCAYLQERIAKTRVAKSNISRGINRSRVLMNTQKVRLRNRDRCSAGGFMLRRSFHLRDRDKVSKMPIRR
jgi:hypothetical protein